MEIRISGYYLSKRCSYMPDNFIERVSLCLPKHLREELPTYLALNEELAAYLKSEPDALEKNKWLRHVVTDVLRTRVEKFKDGLTGAYGVYTRAFFDEQMPRLFSHARREYRDTGKGISLLFVDMVDLKWVNENMDYFEGDRRLQMIAKASTDVHTRNSDLVVRFGGDEFVAIEPSTNRDGSLLLATRLKEKISSLNAAPPLDVHTGIGSFSPEMGRYQDLIEQAEAELRLQKKEKKTDDNR